MTIDEWLAKSKVSLSTSETPELDAEVLLAVSLGKDRSWVHAHNDKEIDKKLENHLEALLVRRQKHEPMAYILGYAEFYGRRFFVSNKVLVPRPESEAMIDLFMNIPLNKNQTGVADLGCGSGVIGITAKLERPELKEMTFIDIDADALAIAHKNSQTHNIKGYFYPGDLLEAKQMRYEILLCNLPYVPDDYAVKAAVRHEPPVALFGGKDGLNIYRKLFTQINTGRYGDPLVLTESLPEQHENLAEIAHYVGYTEIANKDFVQVFRRTIL